MRLSFSSTEKNLVFFIIGLFFSLLFPLKITAEEKTDKFRFAVMGCMHLGFCNSKVFGLAVEEIKKYTPDFTLFLGGMVDKSNTQTIESLWQEFDRITATLKMPVFNIPSNCSLAEFENPEEFKNIMEKSYLDRYKNPYYSFEHKNNLFIFLDSTDLIRSLNEETNSAQENFLKQLQQNTSQYNNIFIALHQPVWRGAINKKWKALIQPFEKDRNCYVFSSNSHFFNITTTDNVTEVTTGAPPCLKKISENPTFPHFLIVEVNNKKASLKIIPIGPIQPEKLGTEKTNQKKVNMLLSSEPRLTQILTSSERLSILPPDRITEALKIKQGMNILDIGAGTGLFTFHFSEALKNTGKVFATDIDKKLVNHIKEKAAKARRQNIFPVVVQEEGVDPFYKQQSFDIIFVSGVYDSILNPLAYFKELAPSLKKNTGRLYIIHLKNVSNFSEVEFGDFKTVVKILHSKTKDFPLFKSTDKKTRDFIINYIPENNNIAPEIRSELIKNFNELLAETELFNDLSNYYASEENADKTVLLNRLINYSDIQLAIWLFVNLEKNGVFGKTFRNLTKEEKRQLLKFNRLLIAGIFQSTVLNKITTKRICVEKNSVISTMKKAGFTFVKDHDSLTHHYFLEFKRKN